MPLLPGMPDSISEPNLVMPDSRLSDDAFPDPLSPLADDGDVANDADFAARLADEGAFVEDIDGPGALLSDSSDD
jgi:hypothetical protein